MKTKLLVAVTVLIGILLLGPLRSRVYASSIYERGTTLAAQQSSSESAPADADEEDLDFLMEEEEVPVTIADPIAPFNRAMYHLNDKLYFWILKPVAQGYNKIFPEGLRISIRDFFTNIFMPIRFVNCLLQANLRGAGIELSRFSVNTIFGVAGFFDPATKGLDLPMQDEDFGQTLGVWGLGHGFYIMWPVFGPSSPRDTVGLVGDYFLNPLTYLEPWYVSTGVKAYEKENKVSLRLGDYEALKEAAIDPYIAIRDAYVQHRKKLVEERGKFPEKSEKAK
ncbi:MAG: VacJ family lipoprotein [Deltaproteobacteria bacterium]|nr:VacJ family lipoprotein [Deltaproteobacteria bacterium]MBW2072568.1 VacJ family lipoprotein [Deltaproteobacteria bacterium]